jgi:hypothetical protein
LWDILRNGTSSSPYGNGDGSTTFNVPDLRTERTFVIGNGYGTVISPTINHSHQTSSITGSSLLTNNVNSTHSHNYSTQFNQNTNGNTEHTSFPRHTHNFNVSSSSQSSTVSSASSSTAGNLIRPSIASSAHTHTCVVEGSLENVSINSDATYTENNVNHFHGTLFATFNGSSNDQVSHVHNARTFITTPNTLNSSNTPLSEPFYINVLYFIKL